MFSRHDYISTHSYEATIHRQIGSIFRIPNRRIEFALSSVLDSSRNHIVMDEIMEGTSNSNRCCDFSANTGIEFPTLQSFQPNHSFAKCKVLFLCWPLLWNIDLVFLSRIVLYPLELLLGRALNLPERVISSVC